MSAWPYSASGGYIGLITRWATGKHFDDFGGGTRTTAYRVEPGGNLLTALAEAIRALFGVQPVQASTGRLAAAKPAGASGWVKLRLQAVPPEGQIWRSYYYAGSQRVAMRETTSTTSQVSFLLSDHLGSTMVVTDSAGGNPIRQLYKPWGETRFSTGSLPTSYKYTGQREMAAINLYWVGSRWYDPALGRWIQPDAYVPEAVQGVQAWDRYAYVNNSPVNFNDPSGHCLILCTAIIGGAVGGIVGAVGYTAYIVAKGGEFNTGHMLLATGGGAAAGALIGTGVGIAAGMSTAAATTAAVTGAGVATTATTTVINVTGGDPNDEINAASQTFGKLSQAANYEIQLGSQLKNAISGTGLQVHHLIEQRLAPALGQSAAQAREWLSAAVTSQEHQVFTNAWRSAVGYINSNNPINTVTATTNDVWTAAQRIYADYPALLDAARKTILGE